MKNYAHKFRLHLHTISVDRELCLQTKQGRNAQDCIRTISTNC